jgi:hypothetical protein
MEHASDHPTAQQNLNDAALLFQITPQSIQTRPLVFEHDETDWFCCLPKSPK